MVHLYEKYKRSVAGYTKRKQSPTHQPFTEAPEIHRAPVIEAEYSRLRPIQESRTFGRRSYHPCTGLPSQAVGHRSGHTFFWSLAHDPCQLGNAKWTFRGKELSKSDTRESESRASAPLGKLNFAPGTMEMHRIVPESGMVVSPPRFATGNVQSMNGQTVSLAYVRRCGAVILIHGGNATPLRWTRP
jgi:hypothetical protein